LRTLVRPRLAHLVALALLVPLCVRAQPKGHGSLVGDLTLGEPDGGTSAPASAPASPAGSPDGGTELPVAPAPAGSDAPLADEHAADRIVEIRIDGNKRTEAEAIRRSVTQKVGQLFDPTKTADDLRSVWRLKYFSDVQLLVQRLPGGIVYVVRVTERPIIRSIKLEGNDELSKDDLKDSIDLKPFTILDNDAVRQTATKIHDKYIEKGFYLADVKPRIEAESKTPGEVNVVFVINEHAKVQVKQITFVGTHAISADELKGVIFTKEASFLSFLTSEGTYREEIFQRDLQIIQADYYDHGYINVKVDKPLVSISPDKRFIFITIKIDEGERFKIGKVDFAGDLVYPKEKLAAAMRTQSGQWFNRSELSRDIQTITDLYYDQGYAYANIEPLTPPAEAPQTVNLTFQIQKGKPVTIERIDILGNTKTRDRVIRREMRVYEGDLFNGTGLRVSKERVTALGFFESVDLTHKPGSSDDKVIVEVNVKEKATGTFQVGFGFSSVESFIFTAQISQNNFLGWGQTVSASAQISGLRSLVQLSYYDPYFLDTNYIFSADFFRTQTDQFDFIRNSLGGDLTLGYHFWEDVLGTVTYTHENVTVEPGANFDQQIPLANRFRNGTTSSLRFAMTWDRRDNRLFPSKGFMEFASVEVAPSFLGGSFNFARYTAFSRYYQPLFLGFVFKVNANLGYIQELDPNNPLPISEQYLLGGINSIRGYQLASISPTTLVGTGTVPGAPVVNFVTGGNKQLIFNFELEFPIVDKVGIKGVLFYDAGNAYAQDENFFQSKQNDLPLGLFHSVGFGFRWFSPVGPLRFEWGIPLTKRPQDQSVDFEFTIGNFF
jgi:outer membrane protein insertion porin family